MGDPVDDDGEAFLAVYTRWRDAVRKELESAGLSPREAENRLGTVFIRALDPDQQIPATIPLQERLMRFANEVAADPEWVPYWPRMRKMQGSTLARATTLPRLPMSPRPKRKRVRSRSSSGARFAGGGGGCPTPGPAPMGFTAQVFSVWELRAAELRDELASVIEEAARLVLQPDHCQTELSVLDIRARVLRRQIREAEPRVQLPARTVAPRLNGLCGTNLVSGG
jgi:hypothetical protein